MAKELIDKKIEEPKEAKEKVIEQDDISRLSFKHRLMLLKTELKAPKSQYNDYGKYSFRNAEDILEAAKPLLKKYFILLKLTDDLFFLEGRFYVKATARLNDVLSVDEEETVAYAREEESKKGMDGSQITGSSSSYARKYALNGLFNIDDTKDSDTTNKGDNNSSVNSKVYANEPKALNKKEVAPMRSIKPITKAHLDSLIAYQNDIVEGGGKTKLERQKSFFEYALKTSNSKAKSFSELTEAEYQVIAVNMLNTLKVNLESYKAKEDNSVEAPEAPIDDLDAPLEEQY